MMLSYFRLYRYKSITAPGRIRWISATVSPAIRPQLTTIR